MANAARDRRPRQGSHLWPAFDKSPRSGGRPAPFLPDQLPGLEAWFRFGAGITSSGGAVSQWNDQSGNGRHLKQATGSAQPALQADGSILFDGSSDSLKCDAFTLAQPITYYLLFKQVTWTAARYVFDGNINDRIVLGQKGGGASPELIIYAGSVVATNSNLILNQYGALAAVVNGTGSVLQVNNTTPTTGNAGVNSAGGFSLGSRGDGGAAGCCNIQVKEVAIYAAPHDAPTRARIISYLAEVGGLSI